MKFRRLFSSAAGLALLCAAVLIAVTVAHAAQYPLTPAHAPGMNGPLQAAGSPPPGMLQERNFPRPTNLKVLPKDLTGEQVREIMRHWAGDLGVECDTCHAAYPHRVGPSGRPMLEFSSDAKPDKRIARIMYTMMELDKKKYIAKVEAMNTPEAAPPPLTCGTCHRGHLQPEAYVPPRREHGPRMEHGPAL